MRDATNRVVVAVDKFRSTASAPELAVAIQHHGVGNVVFDVVAVSDGGEGFRRAFVGDVITVRARDPWGDWHDVPATLVPSPHNVRAIIEVAEIIGRGHRGAPTSVEALAASSAGVGDAVLAVARVGATRVVVGCGGSASSDGGEGCFDMLIDAGALGVTLTAATDIGADYGGAVRYAEQKGVARADVEVVTRRLAAAAERFERATGRDVRHVARAGAAGGLGGALFALGGQLVGGFDEVARSQDLAARISAATTVVTGEGRLDAGSLEGKVVAEVCALTGPRQRVLVVCGSLEVTAADELRRRYPWVEVRDLVSRVGEHRARTAAAEAVGELVGEFLREGC